MQNLNFVENLMILHHFTKNLFKYSSIKDIDPNLNETHAKILLFVYKHNEKSMSKINSYIGIQKGAFTTSVDTLINNSYILKRKDIVDKRTNNLELTDKGLAVAETLEEGLYKYIDNIFKDFNPKERDDIRAAANLLSSFCLKNKIQRK